MRGSVVMIIKGGGGRFRRGAIGILFILSFRVLGS